MAQQAQQIKVESPARALTKPPEGRLLGHPSGGFPIPGGAFLTAFYEADGRVFRRGELMTSYHELGQALVKSALVTAACRGLIPGRLVEAMIRRLGLRGA